MATAATDHYPQQDGAPFDIDKSAAVVSNDPAQIYEEYRFLRKQCPVIHTSQYGGYWLLTRYEDVKRAAMDSETYISSVKAVVPSDPRGIRRPPLNFDAPAHTPFRTALERTVKPARLRRLREPLQKHAEAELAPLLLRGRGDISAEFAANFVARMESEWLNLEPDVAPKLAVTAASWLNAWRMQDGETVTANSKKMYDIAQNLLADRRVHPRDPEEDPASSLLLEKDAQGNPLSEEHLIGCLRQSLVVGVVAPPILIGSICLHLSKDKDLQRKLREDESLIPAALEEFLRLYSPYRGFARTTSKDVQLHGKTIHPKEPITLCYTAANRDPEVFENPDEFILNRENVAAHMGFGRGRHRCAGMPLARLALDIVLRVILRSTKDFEVDGELQFSRMPELGIISCPMSGVELVLTALLSQIYAALSRNRTLRMTSQTFYGLSMHWAQYCGMYDVVPSRQPVPQLHDPIEVKMQAWRSWAARETQLRTLLGLCVIDGVVSQFSGNLVNTWSATNSLPLSADEEAFAADTVDNWIHVMTVRDRNHSPRPERFSDLHQLLASEGSQSNPVYCLPGLLNIRIVLEILASLTTDFERTTRGAEAAQKLAAVKAMVTLRRHISQSTGLTAADKTIGLLRWHAVCLDLVVSTARGARRMCYHYNITQHIFGGKKREEPSRIDPDKWTRGLRARKCLLHALEIHKIASEVPLGIIHDTCLPGALFAAATTYSSFALPGVSKIIVPASVDWGTVILCGLDDASETSIAQASDQATDTLAFLNNVGEGRTTGLSQHWGVTQEMEEVVGAWEARCI
ncbi:cytochrome P450 [Colletotrichum karsti]|uniref:Cytochrome P450 n=1 Tax=Colletotrichum karsti TaxID=1095194 RepID=A0A9P6I7Q4_9PEZI|nr:cytochrome P450 [Colletotrichum karsti]KAF9878442.1 cytochrome P450 [Colletotrichum karsti]